MDLIITLAYSICIPLIIALFAIAFPLLLQTISRIDDKYHSTRLTEVFYKENISRLFIAALIASLGSIPVWIFRLPRNIEVGIFNFIVNHSAIMLLGFSTLILIILLFTLVNLIRSYYNPTKLLKRLTEKHDKAIGEKKRSYFLAISDILYYSIQQNNEDLARDLVTFYAKNYVDFRKNKKGQIIKFPNEYYDTIFEANELLCLKKKKTISYYNDSLLLNLLFDNIQNTVISEETFSAIWLCLRQAINYERDDIVFSYWKAADHHFNFLLPKIHEERKSDFSVNNKMEVYKRENERDRFLEFHYALGGLLMYTQKYKLISRLLKFTNSQPPKYVLVPGTMIEVINRYMLISADEPFSPFQYLVRYNFPEVDGVNRDGIIRMWIKKYLALLLLRQYTLHDYNYGRSVMDLPSLPTTLSGLNLWKSQLGSLEKNVEEILDNKYLLNKTGFSHLTDDWFIKNNKQKPIDLINELIGKADNNYLETKNKQQISEGKRKDFLTQSKKIIIKTIASLAKIFSTSKNEGEFNTFIFGGMYHLMDKGGFAEDQDISYVSWDSAVAEALSANMQLNMTYTFLTAAKRRYLFKRKDIFTAIDKMNFIPDDYVIIAFRVNLDYLMEDLNITSLTKNGEEFNYNGLEIINLGTYVEEQLYNSFFVVAKNDLPILTFNEPEKGEIKKYDLELLDDEVNLYGSLLDMKDYPNLAQENIVSGDATNLSQKVLACLVLNMDLQWKPSARCYQFKMFYQFSDSGNPNTFDDLEPLPDSE